MTLFEAIKAVEKVNPLHGNSMAVSILTAACNVYLTKDERNRVIKMLLEHAAKEAA